ncbi:MAG TPA: SRPBCC family protein [Acidimicrobiales bacterium]|nr:SRPBCC family protein [Acidimicrobiales bacterium]HVV35229.1 SRPBCC family protein [Acidimicrobiales bacterium]
MSDQATESIVVAAPPERVFAVVTDFPNYPTWAADIKEVTVVDADPDGTAHKVRFRAAAFGRSTAYTLAYDYSAAPNKLSWVQETGDITARIDGTYDFERVPEGTKVTYHLEVDLKFPVPGFIKQRAAQRIVGTALRQLRMRVEALAKT